VYGQPIPGVVALVGVFMLLPLLRACVRFYVYDT
jgi:hypothetical protein